MCFCCIRSLAEGACVFSSYFGIACDRNAAGTTAGIRVNRLGTTVDRCVDHCTTLNRNGSRCVDCSQVARTTHCQATLGFVFTRNCERSGRINRIITACDRVCSNKVNRQSIRCRRINSICTSGINCCIVQRQLFISRVVCNGRSTAIAKNIVHVRASNRCTLYRDIVVDRSECNFFCKSFIVPLKSYILRYLSVSTLIYCDSIASLRDASKSVLTITVRRRGSYHRRGSVCASCAQLDACTGNEGGSILNRAGHSICCRGSSHVTYITTISILPIDFQCPVYYRSRQLSAIVKLNQSCAGCIFCCTISATYFTFSISTITSIYFRVASCNYYFFIILIEMY